MGIQGLLPLLKSIHKPCNLKKFAGQTIGVDAYGWLHRGTVSCAIELALDKPTTKWIEFAMNRVRMLTYFGVKPYLVFDGDYLPSKAGTERDRAERRRESKKAGLELLRMGKTAQAHLELQKSIDVTPEMARQLIEELKKAKVDYVVAPYEADSQMVYLERQGVIQGILSEDSDLLVFGAKRLLTKLDQYGDCILISRDDFTACREVTLAGWSDAEFRCMAILSGCDYLPGIDKMGLKTAHRMIRKHKTVERIVRAVQFDGKMRIPSGYLDAFRQAESTFLYQWVYCPEAKRLVNLNEPPPEVDVHSLQYIGKQVESSIATKVARGDLHPHTKTPIVVPQGTPYSSRAPLRSLSTHATPDLKSHQSIESFFKPRRTPLAELDPNSFTPSPSQQRLLEQQPLSWSAEPLPALDPRRTIARAMTDTTRSGPQPVRRSVSEAWPSIAGESPKRQRLCSDNTMLSTLGGTGRVMAGASRFFSNSLTDGSPSVRKSTKSGRSASGKVNIWSDDSIEEAMSQLPDIDAGTSSSNAKKVAVFCDEAPDAPSICGPVELVAEGESQVISQDTDSASVGVAFSPGADQETPATSFGSTTKVTGLLEKYTFTGHDDHGHQEHDTIPCSSPPPAIRHVKSSLVAFDHDAVPEHAGEITDAEWLAAEAMPIKPLADLNSITSLGQSPPKGSEDLLVPDSEGEEEALARPRFKLDLGRFAFAG